MSDCLSDPAIKAEAEGKRLVRAGTHELFVDLDSREAMERFLDLYNILVEFELVQNYEAHESFTPGHFHVTVQLDPNRKPLDYRERVMLELALGSDPKRGVLALRQIAQGYEEDSSVFFERPL